MKHSYYQKNLMLNLKEIQLAFWIEKINSMPYEMTSSMYLDFKSKKKLELEWLSGFILNLGKSMNLNSRINNEIVSGIKAK